MKITIHELEVELTLGVYPEELVTPRKVLMNISIDYDATAAAKSDNFADAFDYGLIEQRVLRALKGTRFALLEALAEYVAELILEFELVREVWVDIDKPGALAHARSVSVAHHKVKS